jgi:hypothetical protein
MKRHTILTSLILIALFAVYAFAQNGKTPSVTTVRDADRPTRQPFYVLSQTNLEDVITVPEGKILVIESVSGIVATSGGSIGALVLYGFDANNATTMLHVMAPSFQNSVDKITYYTHQARYYVPAGTTVKAYWNGEQNQLNLYATTISGHYVDVP